MAERDATGGAPGPEGLAGGPGPTPPGFDDGTPRPLEAPAAGAAARSAREEAPARAPAARGDPEEPDPS